MSANTGKDATAERESPAKEGDVPFGQWFRAMRRERGLKRAVRLSRSAGLCDCYVADMERGKAVPKSETVRQLARAMKLSKSECAEMERRAKLARAPRKIRVAEFMALVSGCPACRERFAAFLQERLGIIA